jgi:hypothetical protein
MAVSAADPDAAELDAAFAGAMGKPPKPAEPKAPPVVDHDAPHGRGEDGAPLAPYGHNKDGSIRRSNAGRKSKKDPDAARVAPGGAPAAEASPKGAGRGHDYTGALTETADAAWLVMSVTGRYGPELPLVGRLIPAQRLGAQAALFKAHADGLVGAVNYAAQHSDAAARWAAKLEKGEVSWALMFGFMVMPFFVQSMALWKLGDGERLGAEADAPTLADLAARNGEDLDGFLTMMKGQMAAAAALSPEQQAELLAAMAAGAGPVPQGADNGH